MIDMSRKYRTAGGREVTLYCTNAPGAYPVHGRIGDRSPLRWNRAGFIAVGTISDRLVEVEADSVEEIIRRTRESWTGHNFTSHANELAAVLRKAGKLKEGE